ncbi:MAG TPA: hypothetical protein PLJ17_07160 [Syntrophorhabdaceae bacterium]|nr:hypothetical protein [Syntrophorhabdaceae bacterium]HQH43548.1 hypothetical protein [Syntrophorhabdaceae bacterium]
MSYLCCTKKIIDILGVPPNQYEPENDTSVLGPWYANIFLVNRKKCVIFVNSKTLFCFVVINQTKKDIKQITSIFRRNLMKRLHAESMSLDIIDRIMKDHEKITICKTYDRSILGAMNELTFHFRVICEMNEGLANMNIDETNTLLAGTIMRLNNEYIMPRETLVSIAG